MNIGIERTKEIRKYIEMGYMIEQRLLRGVDTMVFEITVSHIEDGVIHKAMLEGVSDLWDYAMGYWKEHHRQKQINKII